MADINAIAKQFSEFYYATFDSNRANLQPLYREDSMLFWEGSPCQGALNITKKLSELPFQKVSHKVVTLDVQPSAVDGSSLVLLVTGLLIIDDSTNPLQFSQLFKLVRAGEQFYVLNDIFRLIYG